MPRKSAKASQPVSSESLTGCCITFADNRTSIVSMQHPDLATYAFDKIKEAIAEHEGTFTNKLDGVTHVVATPQQYSKKLAKIKQAIDRGDVKIIDIAWLVDSFAVSHKIDETKYLLHKTSDSSDTTDGSKANNDVKNEDEDQEEQESKPRKLPTGRKRAREDSDQSSIDAKKTKAEPEDLNGDDDTKAKSGSANKPRIPVDDGCPDQTQYEVYVDDNGIAYDCTLNQTNTGENNNKYYRIQVLKHTKGNYHCWTRWGRVGEKGQSKMLGGGNLDHATLEFNKKFKDKNGNTWENRENPARAGKYTFIELNYEQSDDEEEQADSAKRKRRGSEASVASSNSDEIMQSSLEKSVQSLMEFIFNTEFFNNTFADLNYDAAKMPLGKLSKKTLLKGYETLKELATLVGSSPSNLGQQIAQIQDLSNRYFSIIPHDFRRNRPPTINQMDMIKKEIEVLENLTDMQLANEIMKSAKIKPKDLEKMSMIDRQYQGLGMREMTTLDRKSLEFRELEDYLIKTSAASHHFKHNVHDIFRIERNGEDDRFKHSDYAKLPKKSSDRRLLWHGSRSTNYGGILSQGLRIAPPEAPVSGYMFGKGVYLADMSSKSANYCCSGMSNNTGLLLLCEVELGKPPLKLTGGDFNAGERAREQKSISTLGVGGTAPLKWKDASCVNKALKGVSMPDISTEPGPTNEKNAGLCYNEYIVYDVAQIKLRYLLRVEMKYDY